MQAANNRSGIDYSLEAQNFRSIDITDVHSHINGEQAAKIYKRAADLYGVVTIYTMTQLEEVPVVQRVLGDRVKFIAVPNYFGSDRIYENTYGFTRRIKEFHRLGCRIVKFFAAPRALDYGIEAGRPDLFKLDSPVRLEQMKLAADLGMMFMVHVADPDTWFATKYSDSSHYGTKEQHYEPLRRLLQEFKQPWIAAHMGGYPENLDFLSELLSEHANLYLDTSATKWMVRELSKHSREKLLGFFSRWEGRLLFGSDIVSDDRHLSEHTAEWAFDQYASRYYALRTLYETSYEGESPIADPDLAMVEPAKYNESDAPSLRGKELPEKILKSLYHDAAMNLFQHYSR